eukprot:jgi/Tetstr1/431713/TSEL_021238.t1
MACIAAASTVNAARPSTLSRGARAQVRLVAPRAARLSRTAISRIATPLRHAVKIRAASEGVVSQAAATADGPALRELNQDDFRSYLAETNKLVVVDFYTDWCGPCKIILPTLVEMNAADPDVEIVKFNCNQENKVLGKELGIRVAPTFHLYKGGEKLAEMTGAKPDKLKELIDQYK